jgi:hypothetical protein
MGRVLLGGLVAGIVVFVWGAVAHMALPLGEAGIRQIPNEDVVLGAMKGAIHEPGFYFFPGMDMRKPHSQAEQDAWTGKFKQGPTGILVFHPEGSEPMSPLQLGTELASNVVAGLLAALLLTQVRSDYLGRVLIVTLLGLIGIVNISVSYWNWYGFPTDFTAAAAIDEVVGWFLAGLALAAIVRPVAIKGQAPG